MTVSGGWMVGEEALGGIEMVGLMGGLAVGGGEEGGEVEGGGEGLGGDIEDLIVCPAFRGWMISFKAFVYHLEAPARAGARNEASHNGHQVAAIKCQFLVSRIT